jgi:hypothetical protein
MALVFSVLLGLVALWALWSAIQSFRASPAAGAGYLILAVSAGVQILNINGRLGGTYSLPASIVTTLGIVAGYLLARRRPPRP